MNRIVPLLLLSLAFGFCKDSGSGISDGLLELPQVYSTQTDYPPNDINNIVPNRALLQRFQQAYVGQYSQDLKLGLMNYLQRRAQDLSLNVDELAKCIQVTGQQDPEAIALPYRAERARYDSHECWILEFICSHSGPDQLGHYRCFIIDAQSYDTLLYITCR